LPSEQNGTASTDQKGNRQSSDNSGHSLRSIWAQPGRDFIWFSYTLHDLSLFWTLFFLASLSPCPPPPPHFHEKYSDLRFFLTKELSLVASYFLFKKLLLLLLLLFLATMNWHSLLKAHIWRKCQL